MNIDPRMKKEFQSSYNEIRLDEKWFYCDKNKKWYLWYPGVKVPLKRSAQSKNFI